MRKCRTGIKTLDYINWWKQMSAIWYLVEANLSKPKIGGRYFNRSNQKRSQSRLIVFTVDVSICIDVQMNSFLSFLHGPTPLFF